MSCMGKIKICDTEYEVKDCLARTNIGVLSNLNTTEKSNVVGAINENKTNNEANSTNIGTLSNLNTTEKTNLVGAINEVNSSIETNNDKLDLLKYTINLKEFNVYGDNTHDDYESIQEAINYCYNHNLNLYIPNGKYKISDNIIIKCNLIGSNNSIFIFASGKSFTNFEADGSVRYDIKLIENIKFESDKSSYWSSTNAGASYNSNVVDEDAIRKYGQRVYIGNDITTPNNIISNTQAEALNGTGFWNKNFSQWTDGNDINNSDIASTIAGISDRTTDVNILSCPKGIEIINCDFIGFSIGLNIKGTYNSKIYKCNFMRCKVGIATYDAGSLPGNLSNVASKVTTITISKNQFSDIKYIGIFANILLQSKIIDNIFEYISMPIAFITSAENLIVGNYNEVVHTCLNIGTNDANKNLYSNNFLNSSYGVYHVYCRYGNRNIIEQLKGKKDVYVKSSVCNCDFDSSVSVTMESTGYFYSNGNSIDRNKTKYAYIKTTGNGTTFTKTIIESSRQDNTSPAITNAQGGLYFNGNEEILSVEYVNSSNANIGFLSQYHADSDGNRKIYYIQKFNTNDKLFEEKSIIENGVSYLFKVTFNDGYSV